jgi:hypothetical protein
MRAWILLACLICTSSNAAILAVTKASNGSAILVTDETGPCLGGAKLAVWSGADGKERIPGCWRVVGTTLVVSFLDGDRADVPIQALSKPTSL